ncbi:hypothetical protein GUJ93_ZPchr0008g13965 [Zizania palustris]|uniref:Uncharacterized protein n=1 Tax=Zizania palustris TaxID=103762 RepID=A0A8J5RKQ1_ZIZPA|nr:hypothetical protein GUJ93_ZPchr0008g13965 [Zizania palustris]
MGAQPKGKAGGAGAALGAGGVHAQREAKCWELGFLSGGGGEAGRVRGSLAAGHGCWLLAAGLLAPTVRPADLDSVVLEN